ncbi:hypothetical protein NE237_003776 [Protea cynaroides]|uniref:Uncharacterized protein n=1 Tax=Protea cynaroides TaxID=273540 RepID=A0A9Q0QSY3_9MAGN|nr:hypothetical protein NE237_003776 [Protea cynaroides]
MATSTDLISSFSLPCPQGMKLAEARGRRKKWILESNTVATNKASLIRVLLSSWRDEFNRVVTACSCAHGSLQWRRGIKAGIAPDKPMRARFSDVVLSKKTSFAAAERFIEMDEDWRPFMHIFTAGSRFSGGELLMISEERFSRRRNPNHGSSGDSLLDSGSRSTPDAGDQTCSRTNRDF